MGIKSMPVCPDEWGEGPRPLFEKSPGRAAEVAPSGEWEIRLVGERWHLYRHTPDGRRERVPFGFSSPESASAAAILFADGSLDNVADLVFQRMEDEGEMQGDPPQHVWPVIAPGETLSGRFPEFRNSAGSPVLVRNGGPVG